MDDNEDIKFEKHLADKRHKELKNSLKAIAESLGKNTNKEVVDAIGELSESFKVFSKSVINLPKTSDVNIELNQDNLITSIYELHKDIKLLNKGQQEILHEMRLSNQPKKWKFDVVTDSTTQRITSVIGEWNYIKPKAQA